MGSILVVDDERSMREFLAIFLKREGHEVSCRRVRRERAGRASSRPIRFDLDCHRHENARQRRWLWEFSAYAKENRLDAEVIVVTAFASAETAIQAMKVGAYDYLTKPFKVDDINAVIRRALEKARARAGQRGVAGPGKWPISNWRRYHWQEFSDAESLRPDRQSPLRKNECA